MSLPNLDTQPVCSHVVVAHSDPRFAARTGRTFRRLGWEVWQAGTAQEVRRLARKVRPALVVLAAELPDESGWLACAKLVRQYRGLQVFIVDVQPTPEGRQFAAFVGAAGLLDETHALGLLVEEALGTGTPAAG